MIFLHCCYIFAYDDYVKLFAGLLCYLRSYILTKINSHTLLTWNALQSNKVTASFALWANDDLLKTMKTQSNVLRRFFCKENT